MMSSNIGSTNNMTTARDEYNQIEQSLIAPPDDAIPVAAATPTIEIIAPATLPEDYTFEAQVGNRTFSVKVPKGGVEEGQSFTVPLPGGTNAVSDEMCTPRISIPTGDWKDGLFMCFRHGFFHPILCNAMWCPLIAAAQVMTRLKLTFRGEPGSIAESSQTFRKILYAVILFFVLDRVLLFMLMNIVFSTYPDQDDEFYKNVDLDQFGPLYNFLYTIKISFDVMFSVYTFYIIVKTRKFLRNKYAIPEKHCKGCEDLFMAVCCSCCTVTQMARHTTDYETYRGVCCTESGLPDHVAAVI